MFISTLSTTLSPDVDNGVLFVYEAVNDPVDSSMMTIFAVTSSVAYLFFYIGLVVSAVVISCGADKNREKVHVAKRQELKRRQREAVLAGRPVNSVIEEVEPLMFQSNSRFSCVRELPDLEALEKYRVLTENVNKTSPGRIEAFMEGTQSIVIQLLIQLLSEHAIDKRELSRLVGTVTESTISKRHPGLDGPSTALLMDDCSPCDVQPV
uniref:PKD_channel domain-containing protein n=1 Tax=Angiostrongylus cantonensis TaxID=6313 RepID=A0A0K0D241_ANGCA